MEKETLAPNPEPEPEIDCPENLNECIASLHQPSVNVWFARYQPGKVLSWMRQSPGAPSVVVSVNFTAEPQQVQERIGYMPQRFGLYEDLTVAENLNLYADLHGVTKDERQQKLEKLAARLGIEPEFCAA